MGSLTGAGAGQEHAAPRRMDVPPPLRDAARDYPSYAGAEARGRGELIAAFSRRRAWRMRNVQYGVTLTAVGRGNGASTPGIGASDPVPPTAIARFSMTHAGVAVVIDVALPGALLLHWLVALTAALPLEETALTAAVMQVVSEPAADSTRQAAATACPPGLARDLCASLCRLWARWQARRDRRVSRRDAALFRSLRFVDVRLADEPAGWAPPHEASEASLGERKSEMREAGEASDTLGVQWARWWIDAPALNDLAPWGDPVSRRFTAHVSSSDADALKAFADRLFAPRRFDDVNACAVPVRDHFSSARARRARFPCAIIVGRMTLPFAALQSLEPGDLLRPDRWMTDTATGTHLRLDDGRRLTLRTNGSSKASDGPDARAKRPVSGRRHYDGSDAVSADAGDALIEFEAARRMLDAATLSALIGTPSDAHNVFGVEAIEERDAAPALVGDVTPGATVWLRVGHQRIACGTVLQFGNGVAIRVVECASLLHIPDE